MKNFPRKRHPARACSGMTLIEMMFSIAISALIMGSAISVIIFSSRTFTAISNYDEMTRKSRNALDVMSADIRQSNSLISYVSNSTLQRLVFTNLPGSANPTVTYSYSYTNDSGTLFRSLGGGATTLLLSNINSLAFGISTRSPSNNYTFYTTTNPAIAKLIDLNWRCSRPVGGSAIIDSDSIQNAKIVIRN